ncbi:unnamed protein product [Symbiodinium sp. CCMP2592]|nr:unnamed protein product [Symbiodinium sp. CCMP2592]
MEEALEMTAQERLFFGGVCPSLQSKREREEGPSEKRPRTADALASFQSSAAAQMPQAPKGKGKGKNKGKATAKGQWGGWNRQSTTWGQDNWPAGQGAWSTPWTSEYGLPDMVQKLTSLAIKHEYAINSMMQDHTLYLFVKPGDEGLLPILFATSEKWNATQQTDPSQITEPLRLVMMKAFLIELGQRLKATKDQPESMQKAKELGWLTEQGQWKTLVWDPTAQDLREKQGGKLHVTDDLIGQSVELRKLITDAAQLCTPWDAVFAENAAACRNRPEHFAGGDEAWTWHVRDAIPGLLQILQCLLWPLWCDTTRSQQVHGLLKHLWHRIRTTPDTPISLKGDLLWSAIAGGIPSTVQAPYLRAQLQYLLQHLAPGDTPGPWEWCTTGDAATPASEQADLTIPMPINLPWQPAPTAGGLWGWGDSAFRPPSTLYVYVHDHTTGHTSAAGTHTSCTWLAAAEEACQLTIEPDARPPYSCLYEVRSIVLHRISGDPCSYHAVHRKLCEDVLTPFAPALTEADLCDMQPCIFVLRRRSSQVPSG